MFHSDGEWRFPTHIGTAEELAKLLTEMTWTPCKAFECAGYIYLNDSTSPDGAQEYAVLKRCGDGFIQVESITFSWCTPERALELIRKVSAGECDHQAWSVDPTIDDTPEHTCGLCI